MPWNSCARTGDYSSETGRCPDKWLSTYSRMENTAWEVFNDVTRRNRKWPFHNIHAQSLSSSLMSLLCCHKSPLLRCFANRGKVSLRIMTIRRLLCPLYDLSCRLLGFTAILPALGRSFDIHGSIKEAEGPRNACSRTNLLTRAIQRQQLLPRLFRSGLRRTKH